MPNRTLAYIFALLLSITISTSLCAEQRPPQDVDVGLTIVLSGPWASWGESIKNGLLYASHHTHNHFNLNIQDDVCNPVQALTNAQHFLENDKLKIVVAGCVEVLEAIAPPIAKKQGIIFALGGMDKAILSRNSNITSFHSLTEAEARYMAPYIASLGNIRSLAILNGVNTFGQALGAAMKELIERKGIAVVAHEEVSVDNTDFKATIVRLIKNKPDAIYVHQGESSEAAFLQQLRAMGYQGQVFSIYTTETEVVRKNAGLALEGVKYTYPSEELDNSPAAQTFRSGFEKEFGAPPNSNASMAYDALMVLDRAVSKCGSAATDCITQELRSLGTYKGMAGEVVIAKDGSAMRPHGLKEFKDGKFQWLIPKLPLE